LCTLDRVRSTGFCLHEGLSQGQNRLTDKCDLDSACYSYLSVDEDGAIEIAELMRRYEDVEYMLSRMIIHSTSEWDGGALNSLKNDNRFLWGSRYKNGYIKYLRSLMFLDAIPGLKDEKMFYYFHPRAFEENMAKICPAGWRLTMDGTLLMGSSGYLLDENGYYILEDGRRVSREIIFTGKYNEKNIRVGNDPNFSSIPSPKEGLEKILGVTGLLEIRQQYTTIDLIKQYFYSMPVVAYQAFQINRGYKLLEEKKTVMENASAWEPCTWSPREAPAYIQRYTPAPNCSFGVIGADETGIPIVVTRVGIESAEKKLVIAGPHGDERNAQRLIMAAQKYFIKNNIPADTVLYFIPCISPTMAFADARGIPVVNENGERVSSIDGLLDEYRRHGKTIPYLHDLIAKEVPTTPNGTTKRLLRTSIQNHNESAYSSFENYQADIRDGNYPLYGIDANRDVKPWLASTNRFLEFIENLNRGRNPEDIKIIMIHGYKSGGGVYGTYKVESGEKATLVSDEIRDTSKAIWSYLFVYDNNSEKDDFYGSTDKHPLDYAGEWNQLLYREFGILSVDIELPNFPYDEGRRGDLTVGNDYKIRTPEKIREDFGNDGVLVSRKGGFYKLLKEYNDVINKYKNRQVVETQ